MAPVIRPVISWGDKEKVEPPTLEVKVCPTVEFEQRVTKEALVTEGTGFTVTVNVNVGATQDPVVGVTMYVAVCGVKVGLVKVPEILEPLPLAPPVIPPVTDGADQE